MHLSAEEALDLIEQRVTEVQAAFWTAHFQACSSCGQQFEAWKQMHSLMKRSHLEDAPESEIRRAEAIFQPSTTVRKGLREIVASMVFDSFAQPALAGARGAAGARQYLLRAEQFDIHVRLTGASPERRLTGQILARGSTFEGPVELRLLCAGERVEATEADASGEFQFMEVPDGPLTLEMDLPGFTVVGNLN
jgi:hypothetical protein